MNCQEAREMFSLKFDNELSGKDTHTFREHLESCRDCSEEWKEWERMLVALRSIGERELLVPAGFSSSVIAQIQKEAPSTQVHWKLWKKAAIGTAAAVLLISGSMLLKPTPVNNIANVQQTESSSYSQPYVDPDVVNTQTQIALNEGQGSQEASVSPTNNENPVQKNTAPETSEESAKFTSTNDCVVISSFLKVKVDDAQTTEQRAISIAQSQGALVQSLGQQTEETRVYLVDKFIVERSQAPGLISSLSGLGTTISSQQQKEDFTARYSDLLALLISLEGQRSTEQNGEKLATLDRQIEQIKSQLRTWDKRSGEQTIVLWIQQ